MTTPRIRKRVTELLRSCCKETPPLIREASQETTQPQCVTALRQFIQEVHAERKGTPHGLQGRLTAY